MNKDSKILFITSVLKVGYGVGLVVRQQIAELVALGYKNIYVCSNDVDGFKEAPIANSKFFSVDVKWSRNSSCVISFTINALGKSVKYITMWFPFSLRYSTRLGLSNNSAARC